jgi:hypothetical protein
VAEFQPFDLGRVIQTAEAIKGMRRQEETDRLQQAYFRQRAGREAAQEQRTQLQFDEQEAQQAREVLYRAVSQVEQSEDPIGTTRAIIADPQISALFQRMGIDPSRLDDEPDPQKVRAGAAAFRARLQPFIQPQANGNLQLETIVGPDGQPIMVPREMAVGQRPFQKDSQPSSYEEFIRAQKDPAFAQFLRERRNQGLSVTLPDGTEITSGGQPFALPKPTQNKLGDAYADSVAGMQRLQSMVSGFDPQFLTYGGKFKGQWSSIKAKVPEVFGQLSPEDQQYLQRYTSWSSDTLDNLNRYVKDITGASMSVQEAERIKASIPNQDDDPVSFQSKLDTTMKRLSLVAARSAYLLSNPAQSIGDISLDRMQAIITDRANALYTGYLQQGISEQEARQRALQEARAQFGLGNATAN